ncbi:MAG: cellobiose phosphorylase [Firmicutes bacterium]|nr:cellobiose phosphorylase [Bacillota bacterium]
MEKKPYSFAPGGEACVIATPQPPRHWYNYLWNEDRYCAAISQMGHGRSYYLNETAQMCAVNRDEARYVYVRDEDSGAVWNIGLGPVNTPVEGYACTHAIGYSRIESRYDGISCSWRLFVPERGYHEIWTLCLENQSERERNLSIFSAVSFFLEGFSYPRYYEMYRCAQTVFDKELNGVFCRTAHPFAPHARYNGYLASTEPVFAYDGDLYPFCGANSTITQPDASAAALFQRPQVVMSGKDCTNSQASLFILGGVLQHKIQLQPGESRHFHVLFGVAESIEEARSAVRACTAPNHVEAEFAKAQRRYAEKYASLQVHTPDARINHLMNSWVKKQVDFCVVGKKGVRDNLQIAAALLDYRQETAREEILECLRHQFRDGHALLTWYPYDDTRYSDQPFWMIWAVCRLIKETGDFSILQESISWQDGDEATVLEHLQVAVSRLILDKGRNGLVRIYFADWNDALNITTDADAESVMLSHQFCLALEAFAQVMERVDTEYARFLSREYEILKDAINEKAWDGKWYLRALSREENIGGKDSWGSKIYLNAQVWAVLSGVAKGERLQAVLEAVDGMEQDFGFPLNLPPYSAFSPHVGRMSGMLPGLFENGGVYCHATAFKILMDCKTGRATKALQTLLKIAPDSPQNPSMRSGAEPYVFTNCYATNPDYYGKSYQSWTTGTSAWCLMGLYEGILGVQADFDGLRLAPCFPAAWAEAQVTRRFRGADYQITIRNPAHKEAATPRIWVDGCSIAGNLLPDFRDGRQHRVEAIL